MFIDKDNNKQKDNAYTDSGNIKYSKKSVIFLIVIIAGAILAAIIFFALGFNFSKNNTLDKKNVNEESAVEENRATSSDRLQNRLRGIEESEEPESTKNDVKAENLTFGQFYKKEDINIKPKVSKFDLPINVKTDVSNYHDVYRKLNLDQYIGYLNKNGFSIIDNPYKKEANDFYSAYKIINKNNLPLLVTDDFIIYYYQNFIKNIFKEIEKDFFYNDFFSINKDFFAVASSRYKKRMEKEGLVNDPLLEGERLEAVFFAVGLELLKPASGQIAYSEVSDDKLFTTLESEKYNYSLPYYLADQVKKEVSLIRQASQTAKSPIMLYKRNYQEFKVPNEYKSNAKLNNFYLALHWMNTVFPLYEQNSSCSKCLLDKDDWLVNFIAANLIAKDLSDNQNFKNQWAKIYKLISYFSGLRTDLTYLKYNEALAKIFGKDYDVEYIFSDENPSRNEDILKARAELAKYNFAAIEGGYNRGDELNKPIIGLRMLTEPYWPNDFIFNQLVNPFVTLLKENTVSKDNKTACAVENKIVRCRGFGMDIINLVYNVKNKDSYTLINTNYLGYDERIKAMQRELGKFNINSWYNSSYWTTLSMLKSMFLFKIDMLPYAQGEAWEEKSVNTALGAWVNSQIPVSDFKVNTSNLSDSQTFEIPETCNPFNYVEPNLGLIKELKAESNMLLGMLTALGFTEESAYINNSFKELNYYLFSTENIILKELAGESLNEEDCAFINTMVSRYSVKDSAKKSLSINFKDGNKSMVESIDGVNWLIAVNKYGDENVFIFGPVFNYKEE
mgnify:CR=1 FL=1